MVKTLNERSLKVDNKSLGRYVDQRKHYSQMNDTEINGLFKRIKSVDEKKWKLSYHALDRFKGKKIQADLNDCLSAIHNSTIIEYKIDFNKRYQKFDERIVLRANALVNGCYNLNAVYSLTTNTIVTVWLNHVKDRHDTLKWEIYSADMKVFGI